MSTSSKADVGPPAVSDRKFLLFGVLSALLLAGLALLAYLTTSQMQTALAWTDHSLQMRGQIRLVRILLGDMQNGERGYLITGERDHLAPYEQAAARIDAELDRLDALTASDAVQQQSMARLRALVRDTHVELRQSIVLRGSQGFEAARAVVASGRAKALMDETRSVVNAMEAEEARRLAMHRAEQSESVGRTIFLSAFFGLLLVVLLGAIYYLLRRQMHLHAAYERTLSAANAELEYRIQERTRSLEQSEARLNGIVNGAPDAIITIDGEENIVLANPAASDMFGYPTDDLVGSPLTRLIPERYRPGHHQHVKRFGESAVVTRRMSALRVVQGLRANGTEFPVDASISQVSIGDRKLFTVILRDITEEYRAKNELERSRRELRELTAALEYVQEEERKRIAQELHDDLGQQLTVLKMDASLIRSKLAPEQRDVLRIAERLESVLMRTVQSVRRISTDLRPAMLDDLGLVPALEELMQHIGQHSGLECMLDADEDLEVHQTLATPLFRVVQESLNNVVKHAQATRVTVSLAQKDSALVLTVEDDGRGIAPDDRGKRKSYGLIGMRERVYALGGEFEVKSRPHAGTKIEVRVPAPE